MMNKQEIINETASFYNTKNRAMESGGGCHYYFKEKGIVKTCGVGRCFTDPEAFQNMVKIETANERYDSDVNSLVLAIGYNSVNSFFKKQYRDHSTGFWSDIQDLHDTDNFWNEDGLSEKGKKQIEVLLEKWKDK